MQQRKKKERAYAMKNFVVNGGGQGQLIDTPKVGQRHMNERKKETMRKMCWKSLLDAVFKCNKAT